MYIHIYVYICRYKIYITYKTKYHLTCQPTKQHEFIPHISNNSKSEIKLEPFSVSQKNIRELFKVFVHKDICPVCEACTLSTLLPFPPPKSFSNMFTMEVNISVYEFMSCIYSVYCGLQTQIVFYLIDVVVINLYCQLDQIQKHQGY